MGKTTYAAQAGLVDALMAAMNPYASAVSARRDFARQKDAKFDFLVDDGAQTELSVRVPK